MKTKYEDVSKPIDLDEIRGWLESDPEMPEKFAVEDAILLKSRGAVVARWIDCADRAAYEKAISAPSDPNSAKKAYERQVKPKFSMIWLNQAEDGETLVPTSHILS